MSAVVWLINQSINQSIDLLTEWYIKFQFIPQLFFPSPVLLQIWAKFFSLAVQASINALLVIYSPNYGILIFACTQVLGAAIYSAIFYRYFWTRLRMQKSPLPANSLPIHSLRDFLPSWSRGPFLPKRLRHLAWSFTKQSFMKEILTDGERYIMSGLQMLTFAEQGIFDVVNNLGSLVARLLFQQVEENAYVFFSKVLPRERDLTSPTKGSVSFLPNPTPI